MTRIVVRVAAVVWVLGSVLCAAADDPPWVPDRVLVRLDPAQVPTCAHCRFARGQPVGGGVDTANQALGALDVQPVHEAMHGMGLVTVDDMYATFLAGVDRGRAINPARAGREVHVDTSALVKALLNTYVITLPAGTDPETAAALYRQQPGVQDARPDAYGELDAFQPTDTYWGTVNAWQQGPLPDLWGLLQVGAGSAWQRSRGKGVRIAITDSGVERTHPDLAPNLCTNPDDPPDGVDNDGNGYVDDSFCGYNFAQQALGGTSACPPWAGRDYGNPCDHANHGSHVSGTAAAAENDGGVIGMAPEATIMPLKVFAGGGTAKIRGPTLGMYRALLYAVVNGADIVNASWDCSNCGLSDYFYLDYLTGIMSVAAAGNDHVQIAREPASLDNMVFTVGASTPSGDVADFSNFGSELDLVAPGGGNKFDPVTGLELQCTCGGRTDACTNVTKNVLSARSFLFTPPDSFGCSSTNDLVPYNGNWSLDSGTSMAAPLVSGTAADVLAVFPWMTPMDLGFVLRRSAADVTSSPASVGYDQFTGYGRLQANRAVGQTLAVRAFEDTWVDSSHGTTNYGTATRVRVEGSAPIRIAYLKFDLRTIGAHQGAALRLCTTSDSSSGEGGHIYLVDPTSWSEAATTWKTRPALGTDIGHMQEPVSQQMPSSTCVTIDITPYVHPKQINAFAIAKLPQNPDGLAYVSREGDPGAQAPQLLLATCGGCNACNGVNVMTANAQLLPFVFAIVVYRGHERRTARRHARRRPHDRV